MKTQNCVESETIYFVSFLGLIGGRDRGGGGGRRDCGGGGGRGEHGGEGGCRGGGDNGG